MKTYAVIIERGPRNFSAYVPDLPGCIATGKTLASVRRNILEAIEFHLDGLRHEGLPIPRPSPVAEPIANPSGVVPAERRGVARPR